MTRITGILIDTYGVLSTVSIDGTTSNTRLSGMYEHIGCTTTRTTRRLSSTTEPSPQYSPEGDSLVVRKLNRLGRSVGAS